LNKTIHVLHMGIAKPVLDRGVDEAFTSHRLPTGEPASSIPEATAAQISAIAAGGGHDAIDADLMDRLPRLQFVASFGVGYDHIDACEAARRGIVVTHTPDVLTDEVADLALGLLLATIRRLPQADRFVRDGLWIKDAFPLTGSLRGRSVGIIGLGRIGKAIGRRLEAFGVHVSYCGRSRQPAVAYPYFSDVTAMARAVDTLIVAAPGGPSTTHLIDAKVLAALGGNGVLINVGRGNIVDETALVQALSRGTILAAGLDVFEQEPDVRRDLMELDNAVLLPHIGSASSHTRDAMAQLVLDNLLSWFAGQGPLTPVPETPWPPKARIAKA
jgi:lactate dehydrogenase-like 2-hydroxyacid dehydrogenase